MRFAEAVQSIDTEKLVTVCVTIAVSFIFLLLTTCTAIVNITTENDMKIEQVELKAQMDREKGRHDAQMEEIRVINKMIAEDGVDPIAARCAVVGWEDDKGNVCQYTVTPPAPKEVTE